MQHNYKFNFNLKFDEDQPDFPLLTFDAITIVENRIDIKNNWRLSDTDNGCFADVIGREILFSEKARHNKGDFTKTTKPSSLKAGKNYMLVILGIIDTVREMLNGTYNLYLKKHEGKPEDKISGQVNVVWETPVKKLEKGLHRMGLKVAVTLNDFTAFSNPEHRDLEE